MQNGLPPSYAVRRGIGSVCLLHVISMSWGAHGSCVLEYGCALEDFPGKVAKAVSELDGWHRSRLVDSASADRFHRRLAGVSDHRLSRRRSALRCAGNMDARTRPRLELLQTSAADGMDGARVDIGVSAHQLVVSVAAADQSAIPVWDRRSDFAPLRRRPREHVRA